jgi:SAM-dependent MidA family methyltransferase
MIKSDGFFKNKIRMSEKLSFFEFMNLALYDPLHGYYTSKQNIFGQKGDFVTAPELTPLFGHTLARQAIEIFKQIPDSSILEIGAGSGRLCVDVLSYLQQKSQLPKHYYILELSQGLKHQQRQLIASLGPDILNRVIWLESWPEDFRGVVLANEVLDAMPVHRFLWQNGQVLESFIEYDEVAENFKEVFKPTENTTLEDYVKQLNLDSDDYCSEVNLWVRGWLKGLYDSLTQAVVFLIDYGYPRHEYYHPDRCQGTIMCHEQQRTHADFLKHPGLIDITAHVDFTLVAEAAHDIGFAILGFSNQASFLLSNGILELLAQEQDTPLYQQQAQQVKFLLQSQEMGEIFKVIALTKDYFEPISGFMLYDKRASL